MSGWTKNKRFWKEATVSAQGHEYTVLLDGRGLKTPAKADLRVPTAKMAEVIASEWQAQGEEIQPLTMPTTRSANAAIDKVRIQHSEVADMIAEYGGSDLVCYRATEPEELIRKQAELWDPMLSWAASELKAPLVPVSGVMHESQDATVLASLAKRVHDLTDFELASFHDLVSLSGSLVLGFAAVHSVHSVDEIWNLSRVDEKWQESLWGEDEEAQELAEIKRQAFLHADRFFRLSQL
nr:ATP12 family protein [uncultured Shimia sp.]